METLGAMRWIKANTRALTTLGLSNVSYGLPYRALITRTYFARALTSGLDSVIINPGAEGIVDTLKAFNVLAGIDDGAVDYIAYNSKETGEVKNEPKKAGEPRSFKDMLLEGRIVAEENVRGFWEARDKYLLMLEQVHNEPTEHSVRTLLDRFWESWQDLSLNPTDLHQPVSANRERIENGNGQTTANKLPLIPANEVARG